ncbi:inactive pancreatic lipase-related protein 1-like [Spodoptera litura]|uniref:Inactive pancreatic lipase-related protein 1-like n=1 Tax=Spodoptera litura TaxID=69820 RepID=A0A9J7DR05_SPOLT|nr:inactive pancreatic lipase-related protein 1-like [Spodoptera litura]
MFPREIVYLFLISCCVSEIVAVFGGSVVLGKIGTNRIEDVKLRFYNGKTAEQHVDIPLSQSQQLLQVQGFNQNNPTVFYIHGYVELPEQESIKVIVNAYLQARPGTNVILLDWSEMAQGSYALNAVWNAKRVGPAAAEQLNKLIDLGLPLEKLHIIGFSLGSQVAGYTARELKTRFNKYVKRVTVLDPAYPSFYPSTYLLQHVNAGDAEFVDVIHTDAGGYGAPVPTGTADFWPNGGHRVQPGCPIFALIPLSDANLCSHWRSWQYYAESVRNPEAFPASPASSYVNYQFNQNRALGMMYMGYGCDKNARGNYYLTTNAQAPFGRGLNDIY